MKSRIVLALSVSDLRRPGLSQASESRSRWASPYCDVKTRARVVLPEPELPNTTMRHITFETARLTRIRSNFWVFQEKCPNFGPESDITADRRQDPRRNTRENGFCQANRARARSFC